MWNYFLLKLGKIACGTHGAAGLCQTASLSRRVSWRAARAASRAKNVAFGMNFCTTELPIVQKAIILLSCSLEGPVHRFTVRLAISIGTMLGRRERIKS